MSPRFFIVATLLVGFFVSHSPNSFAENVDNKSNLVLELQSHKACGDSQEGFITININKEANSFTELKKYIESVQQQSLEHQKELGLVDSVKQSSKIAIKPQHQGSKSFNDTKYKYILSGRLSIQSANLDGLIVHADHMSNQGFDVSYSENKNISKCEH